MTTTSQSLSSLCSICHVKTPRYKCPRCSTRTCSLPCTKLHKARTLCTGTRDPGSYATKNELNAPASFDRDFNFISGVERGIERANRDAEHRGIVVENGGNNKAGEIAMRRSLEEDGITVLKAPKGMVIERENMTHWRRRGGGINWTIMWRVRLFGRDGRTAEAVPAGVEEIHAPGQCFEGLDVVHGFLDFYDDFTRKRKVKGLPDMPEIKRQVAEQRRRRKAATVQDHKGDAIKNDAQEISQIPPTSSEGMAEAPASPEEAWLFYLEAPDKSVLGKTALIPFDGLDPLVKLKALLKGRTLKECPQIWIFQRDPPTTNFLILEPFDRGRISPTAPPKLTEGGNPAPAESAKRSLISAPQDRPNKQAKFHPKDDEKLSLSAISTPSIPTTASIPPNEVSEASHGMLTAVQNAVALDYSSD